MEYFVRHRTTYRYLQDVAQSWHVAHLLLRPTPTQAVEATHVTLTPEAGSRVMREDFFGNACEEGPKHSVEGCNKSRLRRLTPGWRRWICTGRI